MNKEIFLDACIKSNTKVFVGVTKEQFIEYRKNIQNVNHFSDERLAKKGIKNFICFEDVESLYNPLGVVYLEGEGVEQIIRAIQDEKKASTE
jgi:hypothetical protein